MLFKNKIMHPLLSIACIAAILGYYFFATDNESTALAIEQAAEKSEEIIEFDYEKYSEQRQRIIKINQDELEEAIEIGRASGTGKPEIGIDLIDINNDGSPEIFTYFYGHYFCGSHGCKLIIYEFVDNETYRIIGNWISYPDVKVRDRSYNGYRDLMLGLQWPLNGVKYSTWRWSGNKYICHICPN